MGVTIRSIWLPDFPNHSSFGKNSSWITLLGNVNTFSGKYALATPRLLKKFDTQTYQIDSLPYVQCFIVCIKKS